MRRTLYIAECRVHKVELLIEVPEDMPGAVHAAARHALDRACMQRACGSVERSFRIEQLTPIMGWSATQSSAMMWETIDQGAIE